MNQIAPTRENGTARKTIAVLTSERVLRKIMKRIMKQRQRYDHHHPFLHPLHVFELAAPDYGVPYWKFMF
jgi:hypothetical protein